jgi:hypothetical protein
MDNDSEVMERGAAVNPATDARDTADDTPLFVIFAIDAAAYAAALGVPFVRAVLAGDGEHVRFVFDDMDGRAAAALEEYRHGDALVDARYLMACYRKLAEARRVLQGETRQRLIRERRARWPETLRGTAAHGNEYTISEGQHNERRGQAA